MMASLEAVQKWRLLIEQYADQHDIPRSLVGGLMEVENAQGDPSAVSAAGAIGLLQVMPREKGFADRPTTEQLRDPAINLDWGCSILAEGYLRYGTWMQALAAYYGAVNESGYITTADDGSGVTGPQYVERVIDAQLHYLEWDGFGAVDEDFRPYGASWREVAVTLKAICDEFAGTSRATAVGKVEYAIRVLQDTLRELARTS